MNGKRMIILLVAGVVFLYVLAASCGGGGSEYYHVPSVSVDVDKHKGNKPGYKAPAPKFNTRKR